jgi:hypothetical protein
MSLSSTGQKLFNSIISCNFENEDKVDLIKTLSIYHEKYNVLTLVKACCELFDTPKKRRLMNFLRIVIPVKDRFGYQEYCKLFFPSEFPSDSKSMYSELIPFEIIEETFNKAEIKRLHNLEKENSKQKEEKLKNLEGRGTNSINIIDRIKSLETQNNDEYSNELKRVIQSLLPN